MSYKLSTRSLERLSGVSGYLVDVILTAIRTSPIDFGIPEFGGKRTAKEQKHLYLKKRSTKDGYDKLSKHQSGNALDFYAYVNGKASWDIDHLETIWNHINEVAKRKTITLRWGADWDQDGIRVDRDPDENFLDGGHIELI